MRLPLGACRSCTSARCLTRRRFDVLAGPNLHGAFHVFDAARRAVVRRVVVASSGRVTGFRRVGERLDGEAAPRPDGLYGATKAFSEALGRMYADKFGHEVVALRIGTFAERPRTTRDLSTWLSHDDARRLVRAALTAPVEGFLAVTEPRPTRAGGGKCRRSSATRRSTTRRRTRTMWRRMTEFRFKGGPNTARESGGWAV